MTAMKRRGARNTREKREAARSTRGASSAVQQDLAESQHRARAAKTPIAKAPTRQVLDRKRRAYSGQAAREAGGQTRRGMNPADVGTTARRSAPSGKRSSSRKTG